MKRILFAILLCTACSTPPQPRTSLPTRPSLEMEQAVTGEFIPAAQKGVIQLTGTVVPTKSYSYDNQSGLMIQGPAIIDCSKVGTAKSGCFKFDHCKNITLQNITIKNAPWNGIHVANTDGFTVRNVEISGAAKTNLLTGDTKNITIEDSYFHDARGEHDVYLSQSGANYVVRRNRFERAPRNTLQLNCVPGGCSNILVENNFLSGAGNAGINSMGNRNAIYRNNRITNPARQGATCWDDGNQSLPCQDVTYEANVIEGTPRQGCFGFPAKGNKNIHLKGNACPKGVSVYVDNLKYGVVEER